MLFILFLNITFTIFFTDSFISKDLNSNSSFVYKLTSKLKNDFFPCDIPLVLKSKSTILFSLKIDWFIELYTECFISLLKLQTILFQLSCSIFGVTHDWMLIYTDFKFLGAVPYDFEDLEQLQIGKLNLDELIGSSLIIIN